MNQTKMYFLAAVGLALGIGLVVLFGVHILSLGQDTCFGILSKDGDRGFSGYVTIVTVLLGFLTLVGAYNIYKIIDIRIETERNSLEWRHEASGLREEFKSVMHRASVLEDVISRGKDIVERPEYPEEGRYALRRLWRIARIQPWWDYNERVAAAEQFRVDTSPGDLRNMFLALLAQEESVEPDPKDRELHGILISHLRSLLGTASGQGSGRAPGAQ